MALFEREDPDFGSDVATRALSVAAVENDFVERVYDKIAKVYDLTFGPTLHPGRLIALERMGIKPGDKSPRSRRRHGHQPGALSAHCQVTGIDFSASMLERLTSAWSRRACTNVRLQEMDAANLTFADESFDIVYAPYVISVVSDPGPGRRARCAASAARWKDRHPESLQEPDAVVARVERAISPFTVHIGFKASTKVISGSVQHSGTEQDAELRTGAEIRPKMP